VEETAVEAEGYGGAYGGALGGGAPSGAHGSAHCGVWKEEKR